MAKDTDIELSVGLEIEDTKKSAAALGKEMKGIFESTAGKQLSSNLKSIQQQMNLTARKAKELSDKLGEFEYGARSALPTPRYKELQAEYNKALDAFIKYDQKVSGRIAQLKQQMADLGAQKVPTTEFSEIQKQIEDDSVKLEKLNEQLEKAETAFNANPIVQEFAKVDEQIGRLSEKHKNLNIDFSKTTQEIVTDLHSKLSPQEIFDIQPVIDRYKELSKQVDKISAKSPMEKLAAEIEELEKSLEYAQGEMQSLVDTNEAFASGTTTEGYKKLETELDNITKKAEEYQATMENAAREMQEMQDLGQAYTPGTETEEYAKLSKDLADLNNKFRILLTRWDEQIAKEERANTTTKKVAESTQELATSMKETAKNASKAVPAIKKLDTQTKNCAKSMKNVSKSSGLFNVNLKKMTWTFIKAMLGVRGLYMLFRKLREAIVDGINNVVRWEGENGKLNKSLSAVSSSFATFKNSVGAAIVPLVNALAPALTKIIDLLTAATNKVAMFIAAFSGQKTFLMADKVQKNYAADLDKTAKNAKKAEKALKGYLSPLDEINQFQNKDTDTGDEDGLATGTFHEVPVDTGVLDWLDKLKEKFQGVLDYLNILKDAFLEGFLKGLGNWETPLNMILDGVKRIGQAMKDIWSDPDVQAAAQRYAESFAEMVGAVTGTVLHVGLNIGANLAQGIATSLEEKTPEIQDYLTEMFDLGTSMNEQIEQYALAIGDISDVLIGDNAIQATTGFVNIFLEAFMLVSENAARLGNEIVKLITQPIIDNKDKFKETLDGMFGQIGEFTDVIQGAIKDVRDILKDVWEQNLSPMFDNITETISELVSLILDFWNTWISPVIDNIVETAKELWEDDIKPYFEDFMHVIGLVGELISMFINNVWKPLFEQYIMNIWGPRIKTFINVIVGVVKLGIKLFTGQIDIAMKSLRTILEFIKTGFTQGWDKAWEGLKKNFVNIWESIKSKLKGIVNSIIDILNTLISGAADAINGVISIINKLSFDIPDWVPKIGGNHFGLNIHNVTAPQIPHLAQGAVIPPNSEFMAMLGDQKQGVNIETPLDTMVQAFKQALADMGTTGGIQTLNLILPNKKLVAQYAVEGGKVIQTSTGRNPFDLL